jgi:hypothetical protein
LCSLKVEVILVAIRVHGIGNIRDIVSSVRFASNVDLTAVQTVSIHEGPPETKELLSSLDLVGGGSLALVETCPKRVLNPDGVGQIGEGIGVAVGTPDTEVPVELLDKVYRG